MQSSGLEFMRCRSAGRLATQLLGRLTPAVLVHVAVAVCCAGTPCACCMLPLGFATTQRSQRQLRPPLERLPVRARPTAVTILAVMAVVVVVEWTASRSANGGSTASYHPPRFEGCWVCSPETASWKLGPMVRACVCVCVCVCVAVCVLCLLTCTWWVTFTRYDRDVQRELVESRWSCRPTGQ